MWREGDYKDTQHYGRLQKDVLVVLWSELKDSGASNRRAEVVLLQGEVKKAID